MPGSRTDLPTFFVPHCGHVICGGGGGVEVTASSVLSASGGITSCFTGLLNKLICPSGELEAALRFLVMYYPAMHFNAAFRARDALARPARETAQPYIRRVECVIHDNVVTSRARIVRPVARLWIW